MSAGDTKLTVTIGAPGFTSQKVADEVKRVLESYARLHRSGEWWVRKVEVR